MPLFSFLKKRGPTSSHQRTNRGPNEHGIDVPFPLSDHPTMTRRLKRQRVAQMTEPPFHAEHDGTSYPLVPVSTFYGPAFESPGFGHEAEVGSYHIKPRSWRSDEGETARAESFEPSAKSSVDSLHATGSEPSPLSELAPDWQPQHQPIRSRPLPSPPSVARSRDATMVELNTPPESIPPVTRSLREDGPVERLHSGYHDMHDPRSRVVSVTPSRRTEPEHHLPAKSRYPSIRSFESVQPNTEGYYYIVPAGVKAVFQDMNGNEITRVGDFNTGSGKRADRGCSKCGRSTI